MKKKPFASYQENPWVQKILFAMRLTLFLLALTSMNAYSANYAEKARLNLSIQNRQVKDVLSEIENQSEFYFMYDNNQVDVERKVNLEVKSENIDLVLQKLFEGTDVRFRVVNRQIVLFPEPSSSNSSQQGAKVKGKVTDATKNPLTGVAVIIKGTTIGTTTDISGNYVLPGVPQNAILLFKFVGMNSKEVVLGGKTTLDVTMEEETIGIEEVAVIGYGIVKKRDVTGAVSSMKSADIVRGNPSNPVESLQGVVPGVLVTKLSNKPGALWSIAIRGENTITADPNADGTKNLTLTSSTQQSQGTEPLVVIDGVIGGKLMDINPADIESIDILKDASSTAIYGSRGANGVVIITSKRGIAGKPRVTFDSYVGIKVPAHLPRMQNAKEYYKSTITDAQLNGSSITEANTFNVNEMNIINNGRSTDIVRMLTQPGSNKSSTLAISGGNSETTYRISVGYIDEDGMIPLTNYKKYNINASIDSKITKFLKVGATVYENYSINPTGSLEVLRTAYRSRPTVTVYYKDLVDAAVGGDAAIGPVNGYAVKMGRNDTVNPLLEASSRSNYTWTRNVSSQMGNAYAEVNLFKGLVFKSSVSASYQLAKQDEYRGKYSKSVNLGANTRASVENDYFISYTFDNQLTYNYSKGKSKLNVTALQSAFKTTTEMNVIAVTGLPYVSYWYNLNSATSTPTIGSAFYQRTMDSYMGRVNYTYNDKYIFTLTGRGDGASQLAEGHKWAFFPSGAFAWRMADEPFIKKITAISDLKLRVSYGQVGNSVVAPYSTTATLLTTNYGFGSAAGIGFAPNNLANQGLGWERSQELNLGLNLGLFKNRIVASMEVYNRTTKDLIMKEALPTVSGFNTITANVGRVSNKGVEIQLNTVNVDSRGLTWTTAVNFAKNVNKLESLPNGALYGYSGSTNPENILAVGQPLKSFLYFQANGIWQSKDSVLAKTYGALPGQVRIVDQNNDGKITLGTVGKDDRVILGTQLPKFTLGMTNRVSFKNFDLSVMMYYRKGTMFKNAFLANYVADAGGGGRLALNYWTKNNPSNEMYGMGIIANPYRDAICFEDASFLRISDVTLGYNIPKSILQKLSVDKARFYLQVVNPAYFTKFHGGDPEYNGGAYQDDVPSESFTFGFNIAF